MLVVCNGMPRSGSTYQYNLARMVVRAAGLGVAHSYLDPGFNDMPGDGWPAEVFQEWIDDDAHHVVKMHEAHPVAVDALSDGHVRLLYIHRDIRDVAASLKRVRHRKADSLLERVERAVTLYYTFRDIRDAAPDYVLWQRYEEAVLEPEEATRQVAEFVGASLSDSAIADIAQECSVDSAKKRCDTAQQQVVARFQEIRRQDPAAAQVWLRQVQQGQRIVQDTEFLLPHNHVSSRKGAPGQWRDTLSEYELRSLMERYADWFEEARYKV